MTHEARKCGALNVLHDYIGRTVGLKEVVHHNNLRLLYHARKCPRLLKEAAQALLILLLCRPDAHRDVRRIDRAARNKVGGEIFLYRDLHLQLQVEAYVGYAEAALAQHAPKQIAPVKHKAGRQMVNLLRIFGIEPSALRAALPGPHAVHTVDAKASLIAVRAS